MIGGAFMLADRTTKKNDFIADNTTDRLMNVEEVAARIKCGPDIVRALIRYGLLKAVKIKSRYRIRSFRFNQFLEELEGRDLYKILEEAKKTVA